VVLWVYFSWIYWDFGWIWLGFCGGIEVVSGWLFSDVVTSPEIMKRIGGFGCCRGFLAMVGCGFCWGRRAKGRMVLRLGGRATWLNLV